MTTISSNNMSSVLLQQMQQTRLDMFKKADSDGNGGLSLEEFAATGPKDAEGNNIAPPPGAPNVENIYSRLDTDGDGNLTQSEMDERPPKGAGLNQNNLISGDMLMQFFSQLGEDAELFFNTVDQDSDGSLTREELQTALSNDGGDAGPPAGPPSGPPPGAGPSGPPPSSEENSVQQVFDDLDTNQDGTVSLDELIAAGTESSEDDNSSSLLSLLESESENGEAATSPEALIRNSVKYLLSLQEQQAA